MQEHQKQDTTSNNDDNDDYVARNIQLMSFLFHDGRRVVEEEALICVLTDNDDDNNNNNNNRNMKIELIKLAIDKKIFNQVEEGNEQNNLHYQFVDEETRLKIQQSITIDQSSMIHITLGKQLLLNTKFHEMALEQFLLAGEQICLKENLDVIVLAKLSLDIAQQKSRLSNFHKAAQYLNYGTNLLLADSNNNISIERYWRREYELCLKLFSYAAEANYCSSNLQQAQQCIDIVLQYAQTFKDKLRVQSTHVYVLGAQGLRVDAMNVGLYVLKELGEKPFPSNPNKLHVIVSYLKTKKRHKNISNERILRIPDMTDENKLAVMQILNITFTSATTVKPLLAPLIVFRSVNITLQYGLSVMSSVAYAMYGMVMCKVGKLDLGERYASLALELYERYPVTEWLPRVYLGVYGGTLSIMKPLELTIKPLKQAGRIALETGDIEMAFIIAHIYVTTLYVMGRPLIQIESELLRLKEEAEIRQQTWAMYRLSDFLDMIQVLMGKIEYKDKLLECTGTIIDDNTNQVAASSDFMASAFTHLHNMILFYLFGDYKLAVHELTLSGNIYGHGPTRHIAFTYKPLFDGLSLLARSRELNNNRRPPCTIIRKVNHLIRTLKVRAIEFPSMCSCKHFLLKAELAWSKGQHKVVEYYYSCAIAQASVNGILLDHGLCEERLGCYYMHNDRDVDAGKIHLQKAHDVYVKWGATKKAEQLRNKFQGITLH